LSVFIKALASVKSKYSFRTEIILTYEAQRQRVVPREIKYALQHHLDIGVSFYYTGVVSHSQVALKKMFLEKAISIVWLYRIAF
jgi:hypothetical protein